MSETALKPRAPIRRFDVFAEYNRLQALRKGLDEAHAKGYGIWVAKVVASGGGRRGHSATHEPPPHRGQESEASAGRPHEEPARRNWHTLGDEPQTDALFDQEIIQRMGASFYYQVFAPSIEAAIAQGLDYERIRDTIRRDWSPKRK